MTKAIIYGLILFSSFIMPVQAQTAKAFTNPLFSAGADP